MTATHDRTGWVTLWRTASSCGHQCAQDWVDDDRAELPWRGAWTSLHRVVAVTSPVR